ncbi:ABC transporter permease [Thiosocius teredinicola]|uniref:ABC transporter permease n=1 Tax=Thiosocius teredinicola TaxID=1973002 RepID=UPI00099113F1
MVAFLVKRAAQGVVALLVVAFVSFLLFNFVGDPVDNMVGQDASLADRQAMRDRLGLNDTPLLQFARFVNNVLHGEFGISYRLQRPVGTLIRERLPATVELVCLSTLVALVIGIPLGVHTGIRRKSWFSRFVMTMSLIGVSLPTFVIGILLIYVFSVSLGMLPSFGRGEVTDVGGWSTGLLSVSGWQAIILPAVTLSLFQMALILRLVRSSMLEVICSDFIKFARARGLPPNVVHYGHALKNAMMPVITVIGLNVGTLIAFSVVTETVFQWPGLGFLFIQAVRFADIPIMAAYLLLVALLFISINFVVDLLYLAIDPRLRGARRVAER